jgi:hypothetical protein
MNGPNVLTRFRESAAHPNARLVPPEARRREMSTSSRIKRAVCLQPLLRTDVLQKEEGGLGRKNGKFER